MKSTLHSKYPSGVAVDSPLRAVATLATRLISPGETSDSDRGSALPFVNSSDTDGPALRVYPWDTPSSCSPVTVHRLGLRGPTWL